MIFFPTDLIMVLSVKSNNQFGYILNQFDLFLLTIRIYLENIERINQKAKADKTQDLVLNSSYGGRFHK
jgi:hypothetical protein